MAHETEQNTSHLPQRNSVGLSGSYDLRDFRAESHSGGDIRAHGDQPSAEAYWSDLIASMDKMHMAMGAIKQSGKADVDFVRLMLPHHRAAIRFRFRGRS
jgi:hypothetical protein